MIAETTRLPANSSIQLPEESRYFDGHFDTGKILPAVAQISLCLESYADWGDAGDIQFAGARFYRSIGPEQNITIRWKPKSPARLVAEIDAEHGLCSRIEFRVINQSNKE